MSRVKSPIYDFQPGEKITVADVVRFGRNTKHTLTGKVVEVYPAFVNIDIGSYIESINFADIYCGHVRVYRLVKGNAKTAV